MASGHLWHINHYLVFETKRVGVLARQDHSPEPGASEQSHAAYIAITPCAVSYLWSVAAEDRAILYGFLAWQYLIGSCLFLLGGIFNYLRAYIVTKKQINDSKNG